MEIEMASSREHILRRIRQSNGPLSNAEEVQAAWLALPRNYKRAGSLEHASVLKLFEERLRDYDATVTRCSVADVQHYVHARLVEQGKHRVLVPDGFPDIWFSADIDFMVDQSFSAAELDRMDGVVTQSALGIAETGTIVLQRGPGQGRRAISLVPDYHLCIVRSENIVETVPEAFQRLQATADEATTFISGPSATADIEMTRIKGVHGPRTLDVLLVNA
jgi:L-lactate dehydrogenase complex protein LldG